MVLRGLAVRLFLITALLFASAALVPRIKAFHLPGNQEDYAPEQPIAFSHRLHAGELQVGCRYCHYSAERSRHAGIPPASVCMNCHRFVTATLGALRAEDKLAKKENRKPRRIVSPELRKLYDALALDKSMKRDTTKALKPIAWTKIHNLPDFVYFDHRPHVGAGIACQHCHGAVETMERVYQVEDLSMGWCVNCHRRANRTGALGRPVNASTNCGTCHY